MIVFERLSIKNFLSYGQIPSIIDLNTHAKTLICSPNGMGKCLRGSTTIQVRSDHKGETKTIQLKDLFSSYWGISLLLKQFNSEKLKESLLVGDLLVLTESGWTNIQAVHKTVSLPVMQVTTENGHILEGSLDHPVFLASGG